MGVYLNEEKDEYVRMMTMRSLVAGTAALLVVLVVNDFLRTISGAAALAPFYQLDSVLPGVWSGAGGAEDA